MAHWGRSTAHVHGALMVNSSVSMLNTWNNKAAVGTGGGFSASRLPSAFSPRPRPWRRLPTGTRSGLALQGLGKETVGTWLDLASFVSAAGSGARTPYDELADRIGRDVYIDVAGWHLFLKDVRLGGGGLTLAQGLAQQLGQQIDGGGFKSADLQPLLQKVPIKLGQGRTTVALFDVLPAACVKDLENICEDYARRR